MLQKQNTGRETWLDGLRGIAALVVVMNHFVIGGLPMLFRSFWDEPAEENRRLIQLQPFRIIVAGLPMVHVFFVISGYSLSIGLLPPPEGPTPQFYRKLSSAVLRRGFRLYIPIFIWSTASHFLNYLGLYKEVELSATCPGAFPFFAPWAHIKCLLAFLADALNCAEIKSNYGINMAIWTMPYEFRGSLAIFIVILGLSGTRPGVRRAITAILFSYTLWCPGSELEGFFAGLLIADIRKGRAEPQLPDSLSSSAPKTRVGWRNLAWTWASTLGPALLAVYLLTLPSPDPGLTPDWWFQRYIQPPYWMARSSLYSSGCYTIGATILVASLHGLPNIRALLETRPVQFLARISFPMYLIHLTVMYILRVRVLDFVCWTLTGKSYENARASGEDQAFCIGWICSVFVMSMVTIFLSRYVRDYVDIKAVRWARQLENRLTSGGPGDT